MHGENGSHAGKVLRYPHKVVTEKVGNTVVLLTNFYFRYGANIYVFTYEKDGKKKHTFIDTGYASLHNRILPILKQNGISVENIENIIITHRHPDHSGLAAVLAGRSGAKVLVHENFRDFVNGNISREEKRWLGGFDPTELKTCDVEFLIPGAGGEALNICGIDFPRMGKEVILGDHHCLLKIFTCPHSKATHTPDQLFILCSPGNTPVSKQKTNGAFRPMDEIIFSGDLWLMKGPVFERNLRSLTLSIKFLRHRLTDVISGRNKIRSLPREQDATAKDALKQGFNLIRVKPGHGEEFLGSSIIPKALLADRDILIKLGFSMDENKSVLQSESLVPKIAELKETAYFNFLNGLKQWMEMGYSKDEATGFLVRIYIEQSGGGPIVEEDRKERRKRLADTLVRMTADSMTSDEFHQIATSTLEELKHLTVDR